MGYTAFHRDNNGIRPVKPRRIAAALHLPACLLGAAILGSAPVAGQEFGTVFTSPEEREYLDFLREENLRINQQNTFNIQEDVIPDIPVVEEEEEESGPAITEYKFGGIMVRLNGSRMVWLNGTQIAESNLPGNIALAESAGSMLLVIRSNGMNYQLKPGQTFNVVTGQVMDAFQSGTPQAPTGNAAPAAPLPMTETAQPEADNVEDEATQDDSAALSTPSAEDLADVLERLGASEESVSEEQIQEALEMLTEQANADE